MAKIEVINILGKTVYKDATPVDKGSINKNVTLDEGIANGIYLIKVINNGNSQILRFTLDR